MAEVIAARYWCHRCSQIVIPVLEDEIKCPFCQSGFVEEITTGSTREINDYPESDFGSERALSLWAPIFLGMMSNPRRRRQLRQYPVDIYGNTSGHDDDGVEERNAAETSELDTEFESIMRRRRNSATVLQTLQGIRRGMTFRSENGEEDINRERERERERALLINLFNDTITVHGNNSQNETTFGSLGDYFVGPGLDMLLQHLAENDPNRYGTPPARKEAVEALPTVIIKENLQCCVCLDDFETGTEVKELPCKHKFHCGCIMPWLELHSSCPVCRYQLPFEEIKVGAQRESEIESHRSHIHGHSRDEEVDESVRVPLPPSRRSLFPWPFTALFSSSGSQSGGGNGSRSPSSSQSDEN